VPRAAIGGLSLATCDGRCAGRRPRSTKVGARRWARHVGTHERRLCRHRAAGRAPEGLDVDGGSREAPAVACVLEHHQLLLLQLLTCCTAWNVR
jgi:hypothetical protein